MTLILLYSYKNKLTLHCYSIKHDHESDTDTNFIKGDMTLCTWVEPHGNMHGKFSNTSPH